MTVIVDYGSGNTRSVMNVLDRIGSSYILTSNPDIIKNSERLILPGVGHAKASMDQLKKRELLEVLQEYTMPFLGICLGMQLMFDHSDEGNTKCLGVIPGKIKKFVPNKESKVPHMGWNDFTVTTDCELFSGLNSSFPVYFVHSYYAEVSEHSIGTCDYIQKFSGAVRYRNFFGLQFHPEKSSVLGQQVIKNFIKMEYLKR